MDKQKQQATGDRQQATGNEQTFADEEELRREEDERPLAGCDVEHCRRMHD
ncbi:MAG TPA: hypothetical protein VGL86_11610 [Polyangia bacterium]